ncbi:MAG: TetR/AcrR family transcriptional regulator [Lutisporaceae bacterium]
MKKNITKEQIVYTALELMRDKNDLRGLNLREIARTIGCAHTNLYNYFPSYTDLLWEVHAVLQKKSMEMLAAKLSEVKIAELKLKYFFDTFLDIYIDNKGWFRLAWLEYIGDNRPENDIIATNTASSQLNSYIIEIWEELYGVLLDKEIVHRILHNTHCYIVGEVSNYIAGRGLIENELELKNYVVKEAINILTLCLRNC